jgi:hypothetical protein
MVVIGGNKQRLGEGPAGRLEFRTKGSYEQWSIHSRDYIVEEFSKSERSAILRSISVNGLCKTETSR